MERQAAGQADSWTGRQMDRQAAGQENTCTGMQLDIVDGQVFGKAGIRTLGQTGS